MDRLTISVEEAALLLGIGRTLAYEAVRSGELPAIRLGKRWLVVMSALEELLMSRGGLDTDAASQTNAA